MEILKDINGFEGHYSISNYGNVYSHKWKKLKKLNVGCDSNGYPQAILNKDKKQKSIKISRLVALHFIDNPNNLTDVNHIDSDKKNNHISNLEWVSKRENCTHRNKTINKKSKLHGAMWNKKRNKWFSEIRYNGKKYWLGFFKTDMEAHLYYLQKLNEFGIVNKYSM